MVLSVERALGTLAAPIVRKVDRPRVHVLRSADLQAQVPSQPPGWVPVATSVGIAPAEGTNVFSDPADLTRGPTTYITDFAIVSLDAGTF